MSLDFETSKRQNTPRHLEEGSYGIESSGQPKATPLEFLIGRDARGHWLAIERHGLAGGFFASANEAFRYINGDYHTRAKHIELVDAILDPFDRTCVEIASQCRVRAKA